MPPVQIKPLPPLLAEAFRMQGTIASVVRRQGVPERDVEDTLQEVYLRLHVAGPPAATVLNTRAWILRIAANTAIDRMRLRAANALEPVDDATLAEIAGESRPVDEVVGATQELDLVLAAIQQLPARCREVVLLRKCYGFGIAEIAKRLKISKHTVEVHLRTATKRWPDLLAALGVEQGSQPSGELRKSQTKDRSKAPS